MGIAFDNTINLGHLLTALGFMIGGLGAFYALKGRLLVIETMNVGNSKVIDAIQGEIKEMRKVMQDQALIQLEISTLKRDLYDLKTGRGFIVERPPVLTEQRRAP